MYKRKVAKTSRFSSVEFYPGEPIEDKIKRVTEVGEPITDGAPIIYTDRADGVQAAYNIRTDRFEIAAEAMDKVHASKIAARAENPGKVIDLNAEKGDSKADVGDVGEAKS